ncbi:MAG: hypothetical protein QXF56_00145 [Candidatus Micrarchaeia archaeon]
MAWVKSKEPPKEAETPAGVIRLKESKRPFVELIKTPTSTMIQTNWERKEVRYDVFLVPPGNDKEREIGRITLVYKKLHEIELPKLRDAFVKLGLKDGDKIAMINTFYPIPFEEKDTPAGKKLAPSEELSKKRIGSVVLAEILEKCESEGAKAVYCCTKNLIMQHMLDKNGFQKTEYFHFKLL